MLATNFHRVDSAAIESIFFFGFVVLTERRRNVARFADWFHHRTKIKLFKKKYAPKKKIPPVKPPRWRRVATEQKKKKPFNGERIWFVLLLLLLLEAILGF